MLRQFVNKSQLTQHAKRQECFVQMWGPLKEAAPQEHSPEHMTQTAASRQSISFNISAAERV